MHTARLFVWSRVPYTQSVFSCWHIACADRVWLCALAFLLFFSSSVAAAAEARRRLIVGRLSSSSSLVAAL